MANHEPHAGQDRRRNRHPSGAWKLDERDVVTDFEEAVELDDEVAETIAEIEALRTIQHQAHEKATMILRSIRKK